MSHSTGTRVIEKLGTRLIVLLISLIYSSTNACVRVDECTNTACSAHPSDDLCTCSYDTTSAGVCAAPLTVVPLPTNTTGTTTGAF